MNRVKNVRLAVKNQRFWPSDGRGIGLAFCGKVYGSITNFGVWCLVLSLQACVFSNPHFETTSNYPSMIATSATSPFPLNRVIRIRADQVAGAAPRSLQFSVDIRDPNEDQNLEWRLYVDFDPTRANTVGSGQVLPVPRVRPVGDTGAARDRTVRTLNFVVQGAFLSAPRCHRVELLVSSRFQENSRDPAEIGDIAQATWWVATQDAQGSAVNMRDCEGVEGFQ